MENNIFEGAKFGDKFLTRDGKIAIYQAYDNIRQGHCIFLENGHTMCFDDGKNALNTQRFDIVSRYQESIDEEKLDELAEDYYNGDDCEWSDPEEDMVKNAYKAGVKFGANYNINKTI